MELWSACMSLRTTAKLRAANLRSAAKPMPTRTHHPRSHGKAAVTVTVTSELSSAETAMVPAHGSHSTQCDVTSKRTATAAHGHSTTVSTVAAMTGKVASMPMSAPSPGGVTAVVATMVAAHCMTSMMSMVTAPCHPMVTETATHMARSAVSRHGKTAHRAISVAAVHGSQTAATRAAMPPHLAVALMAVMSTPTGGGKVSAKTTSLVPSGKLTKRVTLAGTDNTKLESAGAPS
jgi:hypothetical protein